jgi:hypothetical protein
MSGTMLRMNEFRVNRAGWAGIVDHLIELHADGNLERFAKKVGTDPRTVRRWRAGRVDVSPENVHKVSAATGMTDAALLKAAGYLSPQTGEAEDEGTLDDEMRMIHAASADESTRRRLVRYAIGRQERDKRARVEDLEFFLSLLR